MLVQRIAAAAAAGSPLVTFLLVRVPLVPLRPAVAPRPTPPTIPAASTAPATAIPTRRFMPGPPREIESLLTVNSAPSGRLLGHQGGDAGVDGVRSGLVPIRRGHRGGARQDVDALHEAGALQERGRWRRREPGAPENTRRQRRPRDRDTKTLLHVVPPPRLGPGQRRGE